jgi:O-antigen/teichoic acid export membrane protein
LAKELSVIAKGAGFVFAGFAISKVLAYVYMALVARGLGPGEYGVFSIALGIISLVSVFAALGLYQGMLHFVAVYDSTGHRGKVRGTILLGLRAQVAASLVSALAIFLLADWISSFFFNDPQLAPILKILAFSLPFLVLTSTLMIIVQAFRKIEYKVYIRSILEIIAKIAFTVILFMLGYGVAGVALGLTLSSIFAFAVSLYTVQKKVYPLLARKAKALYNPKELLHYSWPLFAIGFFYTLMSSIDTLMLGSLSIAYDAGIYNVAHPTANLLTAVTTAFGTLFLPVITGLYAQKKTGEFAATFKVVTRWEFALIFPCLLFTVLFAPEILGTMFGKEYAVGAGALIILSIGIFLSSFTGEVKSILESIKRTKLIFYNTVFSGLLNVALNWWLIPLFGQSGNAIIGAAIATAASYVVWNFLALAEVYLLVKVHPYNRHYIQPAVAACIAIACFFAVKSAAPELLSLPFTLALPLLCVFGAAFLALYGLLFLFLRGLQPEDIGVLKQAEAKIGLRSARLRAFIKRFV